MKTMYMIRSGIRIGVVLEACSHVVHHKHTQRGAKSGNTILEESSLNICPTCSLYTSFINCITFTHLMSCVHEPNTRFENKESGCWNPVLQTQSEVKIQLICYVMLCVSPMIKSNILQHTGLYIQIVEANILFGQRM
jgi:hypothetical protein